MISVLIKKVLSLSQGRSTFFALFFMVFGSLLAWFGKLTMTYVSLATALQGYVLVHSYKEDHFADKQEARSANSANQELDRKAQAVEDTKNECPKTT